MATHFDYICIGGGSGGIASANRAAMHGAKVLLVLAAVFSAFTATSEIVALISVIAVDSNSSCAC